MELTSQESDLQHQPAMVAAWFGLESGREAEERWVDWRSLKVDFLGDRLHGLEVGLEGKEESRVTPKILS